MSILAAYIVSSMIVFVLMSVADWKFMAEDTREKSGQDTPDSFFILGLCIVVWLAPVLVPYKIVRNLIKSNLRQ